MDSSPVDLVCLTVSRHSFRGSRKTATSFLLSLHSAYERSLLDGDALSIIEGALQVSDMQVREVMIPRAQMDIVRR